MVPFSSWRVGLAILATLAALLLSRPVIELLLYVLRARLDKHVRCEPFFRLKTSNRACHFLVHTFLSLFLTMFRWIADVQHYMLNYLWWFLFLVLVRDVVVRHILDLGDEEDEVLQYLMYVVAIPLVLGTFAMRKVVTNIFVRYFKWDPYSPDYDARIYVITQSIKFVYFVFILIEIFYIFFLSNSLMRFVLVAGLLCVELVAIFSGFTILKNVATGLFLIFAEPFRTGSEVKVRRMLGFIERVSLARTIMRRKDGSRIFVPNGVFADNYLTSGNAFDAHTHSLLLQLNFSTSAHKIKEFMQELLIVLQAYALTTEALTESQRSRCETAEDRSRNRSRLRSDDSVLGDRHQSTTTSDGNSHTSRLLRRSSGYPSAFDSTGRPIVLPPPPVQVELYAMFKVKVVVLLDRERYKLLEMARTEVNLAIIDTSQRLGVDAHQVAH